MERPMPDPKFKVKERVMTNPAFSKLFAGGARWTGTVMSIVPREKTNQYRVKIDDDRLVSVIYIAEKFLVKEKRA
jgi:hypothetical protein